jgi:hypothetical protein
MKSISVFLIAVALVVGMVGCGPVSQNLEIRTWYDLNAVRNNLIGNYTLMNDLDTTTTGYDQLVGRTAHGGKGWQPIGTEPQIFTGRFDGQDHEIRGLFVNRPDENSVGLFRGVGEGGSLKTSAWWMPG